MGVFKMSSSCADFTVIRRTRAQDPPKSTYKFRLWSIIWRVMGFARLLAIDPFNRYNLIESEVAFEAQQEATIR